MSEHKRGAAASIDIDALLQDTWLQVISLRHGPTFQDGEGRTLWERCIADVGRVQCELKASGLDEASCQHILTAQCALLDEAVKGPPGRQQILDFDAAHFDQPVARLGIEAGGFSVENDFAGHVP